MSGPGSAQVDRMPPKPRCLRGFEHIKRYWDQKHNAYAARILPGEYYVSSNNEVIATILGSCVSACIRDVRTGIGGMNHFMLPEGGEGRDPANLATRYGSFAMEHMINDIISNGGRRENFEIKLFGGGRVLPTVTDVGKRNVEFAREYLLREGLRITSEDVGDTYPRKLLYFPATGRVLMKKMPVRKDNIVQREMEYQRSLQAKPVTGEIDLF